MSVMTRDEALAQLTAAGAAYEITSGLVNGRPSRYFKTAPLTLGDLFKATASDLPFTVYQEERETFASIYAKSAALAHALKHECKVAKGDRVAIAMRNDPDWVVAYMAITSMGDDDMPCH